MLSFNLKKEKNLENIPYSLSKVSSLRNGVQKLLKSSSLSIKREC